MAGHRGPRSRDASSPIGQLQEPYYVTPGNIMTPVQGFANDVIGTPPHPTARGYTKEPGDDPFPSGTSEKGKARPLSSFGLHGGKD